MENTAAKSIPNALTAKAELATFAVTVPDMRFSRTLVAIAFIAEMYNDVKNISQSVNLDSFMKGVYDVKNTLRDVKNNAEDIRTTGISLVNSCLVKRSTELKSTNLGSLTNTSGNWDSLFTNA